MVVFYKNEKSGEVITGWRYEGLSRDKMEEYVYLGMFSDSMEAEKVEMPEPFTGKRLEIGQTVTGVFEMHFGYYIQRCKRYFIGTVIEENRNYFKVKFDSLRLPYWKYYYKDVGVIVFPRK